MRTKPLLLLLLSILLFAVGNWKWPFLRFTNHWANEAFALLLAFFLLVLLRVSIGRVSQWPNRWLAIPLTLGLFLLCVPFVGAVVFQLVTFPPLGSQDDLGFEKLEQIDEHLAVYRTNGGATTDYGIVVRQERQVLPGLLVVKEVFAQYHLSQIAYAKTDGSLTLIHPDSHQVLQKVPLKRFLYF